MVHSASVRCSKPICEQRGDVIQEQRAQKVLLGRQIAGHLTRCDAAKRINRIRKGFDIAGFFGHHDTLTELKPCTAMLTSWISRLCRLVSLWITFAGRSGGPITKKAGVWPRLFKNVFWRDVSCCCYPRMLCLRRCHQPHLRMIRQLMPLQQGPHRKQRLRMPHMYWCGHPRHRHHRSCR